MKKIFSVKTIDEKIKFNKTLEVILIVEMSLFATSALYNLMHNISMAGIESTMFCSLLCILCSLSSETKKLEEEKANSNN